VTKAILFTALVPLALLLVLGFSLLGSRMSETMRKRVELALTLLVYPAMILSGVFWAWDNYQDHDWAGVGLMVAFACMFAIQFVVALRSRTLFPRYRQPKA